MRLHHRPVARLLAAVAAAASAGALAAGGELIALAWPGEGGVDRELRIAPGRFVEACGPLPARARVQWRFEAGAPLDFNIHYHEGQDVRYPARQPGVAAASGTLEAPVAQDYCWMWTNRSPAEAALSFTLRKE